MDHCRRALLGLITLLVAGAGQPGAWQSLDGRYPGYQDPEATVYWQNERDALSTRELPYYAPYDVNTGGSQYPRHIFRPLGRKDAGPDVVQGYRFRKLGTRGAGPRAARAGERHGVAPRGRYADGRVLETGQANGRRPGDYLPPWAQPPSPRFRPREEHKARGISGRFRTIAGSACYDGQGDAGFGPYRGDFSYYEADRPATWRDGVGPPEYSSWEHWSPTVPGGDNDVRIWRFLSR